MKNLIRISALLLLLSLGMTACTTQPPDQGNESDTVTESYSESEKETETEGSGTEGNGASDTDGLVIISNGECRYNFIRPRSINVSTTTVMQSFFADVKEKTGYNFRDSAYSDATQVTEREILMCRTSGRPEAEEVYGRLSYSGCRIEVIGEKIVISAYSDKLLERALKRLLIAIKEDGKGNWILDKSYFYEYDEAEIKVAAPIYDTEVGTLEGVYSAGEGNFEVSVRGTTMSEVESYVEKMKSVGFTLYTENKIGDNLFATYTAAKDGVETAAHTMYYPCDGSFKVVYGKRAYLPDTERQAYPQNAAVTPSITQLGREQVYNGWNAEAKRVDGAPGMCYIVQLADGRYIVIDGGPADGEVTLLEKNNGKWSENGKKTTEDAKKLYDYLVEHNPNKGEKPVIAAWFITHAHGDHTNLAIQFLNTYKDSVSVELAAYNFPDLYNTPVLEGGGASMADGAARFRTALNSFPISERAAHWIFHTGQKIYFPGCEIEILYTQEDYYPNQFATGNHTSSVFRITMESADGNETVFMVMGDAEATNCAEIMDMYGDELKCDILQLTHHGFNGACNGIYEYMRPEICFWACDPYRYDTDGRCLGTKSGYEFNKWIRENVDIHYTSEYTTRIEIK